ncbi:MAG: stringent starvation protein B, partial [Proteobacteria bacterium]|nr:stringent starvation protein B [Pseudomonadota bacterium]
AGEAKPEEPETEAEPQAEAPGGAGGEAKIVSLDQFRKK